MNWTLTKINSNICNPHLKQNTINLAQKVKKTFILLKLAMPNHLKNTFESSHIKMHKVAGNCNQVIVSLSVGHFPCIFKN